MIQFIECTIQSLTCNGVYALQVILLCQDRKINGNPNEEVWSGRRLWGQETHRKSLYFSLSLKLLWKENLLLGVVAVMQQVKLLPGTPAHHGSWLVSQLLGFLLPINALGKTA